MYVKKVEEELLDRNRISILDILRKYRLLFSTMMISWDLAYIFPGHFSTLESLNHSSLWIRLEVMIYL
jgi:hypothetical protein